MAECAAGSLNGDGTHNPVTCCCQHCTSQTAAYAFPCVWYDDDAQGRDPNPSTHSIPRVWNEGPKFIPFGARNLAHDDDLLQSVFVSSGPVGLPWHHVVPSQSVCRSGIPEIGARSQLAKGRAHSCGCTTQTLPKPMSEVESSSQVSGSFAEAL